MKIVWAIAMAATCASLGACAETRDQQEHQLACAGASFTGAVVGGFVGSAFGRGTGQTVAIAAGSAVGALAGASAVCGK